MYSPEAARAACRGTENVLRTVPTNCYLMHFDRPRKLLKQDSTRHDMTILYMASLLATALQGVPSRNKDGQAPISVLFRIQGPIWISSKAERQGKCLTGGTPIHLAQRPAPLPLCMPGLATQVLRHKGLIARPSVRE